MSNIAHLAAQSARQIQQAQAVVTHNWPTVARRGLKPICIRLNRLTLTVVPLMVTAVAGSVGGGVDYSSGAIAQTGRDLDIAITGEGWFQVVADDGTLALSRRGDLRVGTDGMLKDATGKTIMGNGGPVSLPPYSSLSIGSDGTISIVPMGELPTNIVALDRLMLVNPPPEQLVKSADGMIRVANMDDLEPDANVRVAVGAWKPQTLAPSGPWSR